jgi:hypothetical protein
LSAGEEAVKAATLARAKVEAAGDAESVTLFNVIQFALIFGLDLTVLLAELDDADSSWKQRLHGRHLILLLFECVDDFIALLGKEFRRVIINRPSGTGLLARLNILHAQLRTFQVRYGHFKDVRTALAAHRDHDAPRLLSMLGEIDIKDVDAAGLEMLNWLTELHDLCSDAIPDSV